MPRMTVDQHLFERLHDLAETLSDDAGWLSPAHARTDGLRDLGKRLGDMGTELIAYADELDRLAAERLPATGWIPEAGAPGTSRRAHHVGTGKRRFGLLYIAACGAACFPFYGRDADGKITRHQRCGYCVAKGAKQ
jgi:hypothetical protein